jgi:hypothetical protein
LVCWFIEKYAVVFVGETGEQYIGSPSTEKTLGEEIYCADLKKGAASTATAIGEGEGLSGVEETLAVPKED